MSRGAELATVDNDAVLVQGESLEAIAYHLQQIQDAVAQSQGGTRTFRDISDFRGSSMRVGVMDRLLSKPPKAKVVLRKVFLSGKKCNLMQEIWIEDKTRKNSLEQYTIIHVHNHSATNTPISKSELRMCLSPNSSAIQLVDAVNARHLADPKQEWAEYQYDNPFFERFEYENDCNIYSTAIESSGGNTLKLFPDPSKTWNCSCSKDNSTKKLQCKKKQHLQPCFAWDWRKQAWRDEQLAGLFKLSMVDGWHGATKGTGKLRGTDQEGEEVGVILTSAELLSRLSTSPSIPRAVGLFIGIDEYDDLPSLSNCSRDAALLAQRTEEAAGEGALCVFNSTDRLGEKALRKTLKDFHERVGRMPSPPKIAVFYLAGHGRRNNARDYFLSSDFDFDDEVEDGWVSGSMTVRWIIDKMCAPGTDGLILEDTEKYFLFDCCREGERSEGTALQMLPKNTMVIFASQPGGEVDDGTEGSRSPFCAALMGEGEAGGIFAKDSSQPFGMLLMKALRSYNSGRDKDKTSEVRLSDMVFETLLAKCSEEATSINQSIQQASDSTRSKNIGAAISADSSRQTEAIIHGLVPLPSRARLGVCTDAEGWEENDEYLRIVSLFSPDSPPSPEDEELFKELRALAVADDSSKQSKDIDGASNADTLSHIGDPDEIIEVGVYNDSDRSEDEAVQRLEGLIARWVDELGLDLWFDHGGFLESESQTVQSLEALVTAKLKECDGGADAAMRELLIQHVCKNLSDWELGPMLEIAVQRLSNQEEFLQRVRKCARETYFHVLSGKVLGSFASSLRFTRFSLWVLRTLLRKHAAFRLAVRKLGFKLFLFPGGTTYCLSDNVSRTQPDTTTGNAIQGLGIVVAHVAALDKATKPDTSGAAGGLQHTSVSLSLLEQESASVDQVAELRLLPERSVPSESEHVSVSPPAAQVCVKGSVPRSDTLDTDISAQATLPAQRRRASGSLLALGSGARLGRSFAPSVPLELEGYTLIKKLGWGGQGEVWRAVENDGGEEIAVKLSIGDLSQREASNLARISHPNVVRVRRFISAEEMGLTGHSAIVMDLVDGVRLDDFAMTFKEHGHVPEPVVVDIWVQLLNGLEALHMADPPIIHRDVKPSNILVVTEGDGLRVVLVDLGVSKELRESAAVMAEEGFRHALAQTLAMGTATGRTADDGLLVGTLPYWSPEQASWQDDLDVREDLWAVGVVVFELITGELPFTGKKKREILWNIVNQDLKVPNGHSQVISPHVWSLLQKALHKDRTKRFGSCAQMILSVKAVFRASTNSREVALSIVKEMEFPATAINLSMPCDIEWKEKDLMLDLLHYSVEVRESCLALVCAPKELQPSFNMLRDDGSSPQTVYSACLSFACNSGNTELFKQLLEFSGMYGWVASQTLLQDLFARALDCGFAEIVELLLHVDRLEDRSIARASMIINGIDCSVFEIVLLSRNVECCKLLCDRIALDSEAYWSPPFSSKSAQDMVLKFLHSWRLLGLYNPAVEEFFFIIDGMCAHRIFLFRTFFLPFWIVFGFFMVCGLTLILVLLIGEINITWFGYSLLILVQIPFLFFGVVILNYWSFFSPFASDFQLTGVWSQFRGKQSEVNIDDKERTIAFDVKRGHASVRAVMHSCRQSSKAYYEVEILDTVDEARFGFMSSKCLLYLASTDRCIGDLRDDGHSFGIGGKTVFENGSNYPVPCSEAVGEWKVGDIIGLAYDAERGFWHVSVNGVFLPARATKYQSFRTFYPAVSCKKGKVRCNLGQTTFRYAPPSPNFISIADLPVRKRRGYLMDVSVDGHLQTDQAPFVTHRGNASDVRVYSHRCTVILDGFSTVVSLASCPVGRRAYYELLIIRTGQCPQFGFVSQHFSRTEGPTNLGVGDDDVSWGFDGSRGLKWHGEASRIRCRWRRGDVIGLACDLVAGKLHVSRNGWYLPPNGALFEVNVEECGSLFAAISGKFTEVQYNLRERPFKHSPPRGGGFLSFHELLLQQGSAQNRGGEASV